MGQGDDDGAKRPGSAIIPQAPAKGALVQANANQHEARASAWSALAKQEEQLAEQAVALQHAIDHDKLQIEQSLALLQDEFERYSEPVVETYEKAQKGVDKIKQGVEKVRQFEWREWTHENPWKAVGIGFALGLYVGSMVSD